MSIIKSYLEVKRYINEGDVLLFRGKGFLSKIIGSSTETPYSHVGLASWINGRANTDDGILECVEFREGSGGRSINLHQAVKKHDCCIDVYRPNPVFFSYIFDENNDKKIVLSQKEFDGKAVTNIMRKMTGLPYGWRRILWMFRHKLFMFRLFGNTNKLILDELNDMIYPVCSTAVAYSYNSNGYDLVKNRSDEWTEPGDIAKSTQLNYLFTLRGL